MNQKTNYKEEKMKSVVIEVVWKSLLFAVCAGILTAVTHMLAGRFILHEHGKPEFLSNSLTIYSACDKILMAVGYYILGRKIPFKNSYARSLTYVSLNWISNFFPQFMGLAYADGSVAQVAFRISDLVCDSITMIILGIILGVMYKKPIETGWRECSKKTFIKAVVISMVAFPVLVIAADQGIAFVLPQFCSYNAIQVSESDRVPFLINFYSWFLLSGAFIAVFYRLTEFNDANGSWFKFALKYSLLLWTPVVMIMVVFGTEFLPTAVYAVLFIVCLTVLCWINGKVFEK